MRPMILQKTINSLTEAINDPNTPYQSLYGILKTDPGWRLASTEQMDMFLGDLLEKLLEE